MYPEKRHYGTFSPTETGKIPNLTPINVTSADSLSSCALQCLKNVLLCVSVAYNTATGTCSFYPNFYFANLTSSPNTNLYVLQPYWAFDSVVTVLFGLFCHQIKKMVKTALEMFHIHVSVQVFTFLMTYKISFNIFFSSFFVIFWRLWIKSTD